MDSKLQIHQQQTLENLHNTHAWQDSHQQIRQTGHCGRVCRVPRGDLHINDEDTRTREQLQLTTTHDDALLDVAIHQFKERQSCRHERFQRRDDQTITKNICHACTTESSSQVGNHHRTRETLRLNLIYKSGDPSSSNHRPSCSIPIWYKLFTPHRPVHQTGFRPGHSTTNHLYTFQQRNQRAARWHQTLRVAAINFKKRSTQLSAAASGGPYGSRASKNHTCSYSQSSTTHSEQANTRTSKGNTSTSSGEPSRLTHSARSRSNSLLQHMLKNPLMEEWNKRNHGVTLVEHDRDAGLSNLKFTDDILLISGSLKHTTTMLDDIIAAASAHGLRLHATKKSPTRCQNTGKTTR